MATIAVPDDALKLLLMVMVGGGLLALARWSSRVSNKAADTTPPEFPTERLTKLEPGQNFHARSASSAEEIAASLPFDPSLGKVRITKLFFDKTDVSPGPDDLEIFADDLHIQLYHPDSGRSWWVSYFVATPNGLARVLHDRSWRYLYAPNILVLPKYDLEEIRKAVVSRIATENEYFNEMEKEPLAEEESL